MALSETIEALVLFGDEDLANARAFLEARGFELPRDGSRARAWCLDQANGGDVHASYVAAEMLNIGLFGPVDKGRAIELCQVAADAGLPSALLLLASITESQDEGKALALMEQSAQKKYPPAQYAVALKYLVDGASQSVKERGLQYLHQAASQCYPPAQTMLATHLFESGDEHEIREGAQLMQNAAEQGSAHANRMLGNYFLGGRYGFPEDAVKAMQYKAQADRIESEALRLWGYLPRA